MKDNVEDCSEEVVGEGDEAEVMQDFLLVPRRRTMSQGFTSGLRESGGGFPGSSSGHENSSHERSGLL